MTEPPTTPPDGGEAAVAPGNPDAAPTHGMLDPVLRIFALSVSAAALAYILNTYLIFWHGWPGVEQLFDEETSSPALKGGGMLLAVAQLLVYLAPIAGIAAYVLRTRRRTLHHDAETLSATAAYIARAAFWAVLLVGLADGVLSFLHVEGLLHDVFGESLGDDLEKSAFRGIWVHYPLIVVSLIIAVFNRSPAFIWLALLVVVGELQIVILRFIFSYEQAFMADLVRFWYAALFLFSSAYTLVHEGHVRVDVLYTGFAERQKAWCNAIGSLVLGLPVCWVILTMGLASKSSVIAGPILIFEVTQSGFGMYVKYLLAGFLLVYALSMLFQFMGSFLNNVGILLREPDAEPPVAEAPPI